MKSKMLILALLCIVGLAACNRGEVTDVQRDPSGGLDITAQLTETDISAAIADALAIQNPLLRDPKVDLQPGQIVITGTHDKRDGTGTVSGTMTVTLSVDNGAILPQVTQIDIEGIKPSDEQVTNMNQRIAERVTQRADKQGRQITVKSVDVTDTAVVVIFNLKKA
ncbi:MAG: LmeA family phospholipid-binding protein [Chloroflexota bacterium]